MLASVILPRPDSDLKTELNFSVSDSNIAQYWILDVVAVPATAKHCKTGIVRVQRGFCKGKMRWILDVDVVAVPDFGEFSRAATGKRPPGK
jgi:hypothetical protein